MTLSKTASNFTGTIPEIYNASLVPILFEDYARELAARVVAHHPADVLELATGTGVVTRILRDTLAPESALTASDLNAPMLDVARGQFDEGEAVAFQVVDAMDIPFADNSFDGVVCQFGVMFFPDRSQAYREVRRVLRPGGRFTFNSWDALSENPFAAIAQGLGEEIFPDNPPGFYKVPFHYHDEKIIAQEMEDAGFSEVQVERKQIVKTIPSLEDFAHGLVLGNPVSEEISARGGDVDDFMGKLHQALVKAFGESPGTMPLSAWFISGTA